jgi:hypothetical protein
MSDIEIIQLDGEIELRQDSDFISVYEPYRIDFIRALLPEGYEIIEKGVKHE